jgi:LCP family protein required for cell wall assembly
LNHRSATTAAVLSFLWPGLGHAYLGRRRTALVFALPVLVATGAILLAALTNLDSLLGYLISPSGTMTLLVLVILLGAWRVLAMIDAVSIARRTGGLRPLAMTVTAVLVAVVVLTHGAMAYTAYTAYDASSKIFVGDVDGDNPPTADASGSPGASGDASPGPTDDFMMTPATTPQTADSRINILLTGIHGSLTDTLLVLSVNPADNSAVMLSFPRDISNFPLYDGRTFSGKINELMSWARRHPQDMPDGPFPTLVNELGYLLGIPIHYYAAIHLDGFVEVIDDVGGVTVDNPRAINDPRYDWLDGTHGFTLPAGKVKLDGRSALAYVRSRQGVGDSDFTRAARQQQLLVALRSRLTSPDMLPQLPSIIQVAGDTVRTNLPSDRLDAFIALARQVDTESLQQYVLGPPYSTHPPSSTTGGIYTLKLDLDKMAKLSVKLFGSDSRYASE